MSLHTTHDSDDPYLWLEEIESTRALDWAKERNERSIKQLQGDARYSKIESQVRKIVLAKDRIPYSALRNGYLYNFWQDEAHVRGLWRRTTPVEFAKQEPAWESLLDLDQLSKDENENWVWQSATCLPPSYEKCLIKLSRGGKDASVVREFNLCSHTFVLDGFILPEAKSDVAWIDENTIFVGTDFGSGSLTESGYPRIVKVWKRGTSLSSATTVYEGNVTDMSISGYTLFRPEGKVAIVSRQLSFFEEENFLFSTGEIGAGGLVRLPFPKDASLWGVFQGHLLLHLRSNWHVGDQAFNEDSLISLPLERISEIDFSKYLELVFTPDSKSALISMSGSRSSIHLQVLQNVQGRLLQLSRNRSQWVLKQVQLPDNGTIWVTASDDFDERVLVNYESFLVPSSLYLLDGKKQLLKQLPPRFVSDHLKVEQHEVTSKDGTAIPYFVVGPENMLLNGSNPVILNGYGGFEIAYTPYYLQSIGKVWLQKGGVFVVANIRGGGEFGPRWHRAALKENRQKAFDDFQSVAEDLIARKITSPRHLGIIGGSNGGLLVGATFVQRPQLFNAVVCQVPLLDMLRFDKLLAGASWTGEYGDPDDPKMRDVILRYSPYQNLRRDVKYPKIFFNTSTKDDRVHPGHARKMVARMEEFGHDVLYYENIEGGHSTAANLEQRIKRISLEMTYFFQQLKE